MVFRANSTNLKRLTMDELKAAVHENGCELAIECLRRHELLTYAFTDLSRDLIRATVDLEAVRSRQSAPPPSNVLPFRPRSA